MANVIGWNGTHPIFKKLIEEVRPHTIIEVGSWHGQSTITMAKACKALGLETTIYCIDTWLGALEFYTDPTPERDLQKRDGYPQVYYTFLKNIIEAGVREMIKPIPLPSNIAYKILPEAELVYLDASHEYEDVKADIEHFRPLCRGVLFGDDYTNVAFPGVRQAVDEYPHTVVGNWFWRLTK
jgi:cephalosporin hydroxylase